jgi:two-component sensor histidine kinase
LREVVRGALAPHGGDDSTRFSIDGPDMRLQPKAALALGMAVHELATNAAKYGALSNATGRIRVAWEFGRSADIGRLCLRWSESGGPPVEPPRRQGFGSLMIQRGVTHDLGGAVDLLYEPGGVVCAMDIPLPAVPR